MARATAQTATSGAAKRFLLITVALNGPLISLTCPCPGAPRQFTSPGAWRLVIWRMTSARNFLNGTFRSSADSTAGKAETILRMIERGVNSPLTSSCGRLFDGVAALMGLRGRVNYEAQAAMELETVGRASTDAGAYPFDVRQANGCWEIGTHALFEAIVEDLARNVAPEIISRRFHNGLVAVLARLASLLREESSLNRVCLSGGVFHNSLVLEQLVRDLDAAEFEVFTHAQVPAGDGGLSLGQAVIAAQRAKGAES